MQVNPKLEQKGEQILRLLTEFYCSLTGKKEMQNISAQIRQFVMVRVDIKNKEQTAKRILDFFLRMQSKLISKSDQNWDQAFQIATARGQALLKICSFPLRNSLNFGMSRLKTLNRPTRRECDTIVFDIQPQSQELEIQIQKVNLSISQDVKTKTYYFFKWCQYVEHSKELKKMKQREVQNQKISLSFNKYGTKSNYFNAWKILYKKAKVQKDRVRKIENLTRQNILKDCLSVISETAAIISLESILAKKVRQKILEIKKKGTLKKIKTNQIYIKNKAKYQKFTNEYAFMFVKHFTGKVKPLMNKSFQNLRIKFQQDAKLNFTRKIFKQYKKIYCDSKEKLHKVLNHRRANFLKNWRSMCQSDISFIDKSQKFQSFISIRRKRIVITVLSFNKLLRQEQFKEIQTLISNNGCSINNRSLMQVNIKKQIQSKRNTLTTLNNQKLKKRFIVSIRSNLNSRHENLKNDSKTRQLLALRLRRRFQSYVCKLGLRNQFYDKIQRKHERVTKLSSFKSWRKLKYVKRLQQSSVDVINKYSKKLILMNFWGRLKLRAFQKNCIQRLVNSAESVIFRLAYYKMAEKSIFINENVKRIQKCGQKKITKKLFSLLVTNSKYNTERSALIHKVNGKRCEVLLLNKLKQIHSLHKKCCFVKNSLDKNKIKLFFAGLNKQHQVNKDELSKSEKVGKKIFLVYLRKTLRAGNAINEQINRKSQVLSEQIRQSDITRFIDRIKTINKQRLIMEEKQGKLIFKIARKRILQVKQYIEHSKIEKKLMKNRNILQAKRKEQALKILTIRQKILYTSSQINKSKTRNGFDDLRRLSKFSIKVNDCQEYITNNTFTKGVKDFFKILVAEKKKTQAKIQKIQQMQENSLTKRIRMFYGFLKNNKENIRSQISLVKARKQSLFSEFVATSLKCKFSRIKFNCSLKTYARNIMKKAFKSLRQAHVKHKQKQNMMRFDKTSSILMQKSIQKSFKSNTLSQQIQRFNLRKSRHQLR